MNFRWYIRRLRQMSPGEIVYRAERGIRATLQYFTHRCPRVLPRLEQTRGDEFARPRWFQDVGRYEQLRATVEQHFGWTEARARAYRDHLFSFFAFERRSFGQNIRWNYDYSTDRPTDRGYAPWIDYRDERACGNIKYSWEHNRHHHLVELAKASYLTGDRSYEIEAVRQIDAWIEECPFLYGINWSSALEVAIRLINWCFCMQFLEVWSEEFESQHPGFRRRWIASAREHLKFIGDNLSRFSSANNHLVGEAAGLFIGAICLHFPESEKLRVRGFNILQEQIELQTWPDGVNKEQAIGYQMFVFDFFMLAGLLGKQNGVPFHTGYWKRLEHMAEFVAALVDHGLDLPQIGDDDEGYVVRLSGAPARDRPRSVLATAGLVFTRKDFLDRAGAIDEGTFWLTGVSAVPNTAKWSTGTIPAHFSRGGYHFLKTPQSRLIFDCGPLGYLSLAAHGHADALSVIVSLNGQGLFVDAGTYAYHTRRLWRDYFRGTSAHNTLRIDGRDQSDIGGAFMWMRRAHVHLLQATDTAVAGQHDGYQVLGKPAVHRREVTVLADGEDGYELTDTVMSSGTHEVELFFHCAPGWAVSLDGGRVDLSRGTAHARLLLDPAITAVEVHTGSDAPLLGWYSPRFDVLQASPTIRCALTTQGNTILRTRILFPTVQE